jgi:acyl-CoA thioester hydrolase
MTELWREALGPYDEVTSERGIELVVAEATIRYRTPIRFDEEVDLVAEVSHLGTTSMTTRIEIEAAAGLAAEGELRHVVVRHGTTEKTPIPADVREAMAAYAS